MAEARRDEEWDRFSHIVWAVVNTNRATKSRTISRDELNPLRAIEAKRKRPRLSDPHVLGARCGAKVQ